MNCRSGFERDDEWGYRAQEPGRCSIASIALVLLKTGITHTSDQDAITPASDSAQGVSTTTEDPSVGADGQEKVAPGIQVDAQQLATAQKLLLFWRKPAVCHSKPGERSFWAD